MKKTILPVLAALTFVSAIAHATTITDPTVVSGPGDVIDPPLGEGVDESFGTSQATLEARTDLRVLQNWAGFVAQSTGGDNIASFTDPNFPDIRFSLGGAIAAGAGRGDGTSTKASTSGTSDYFEFTNINNGSSTANQITLTITFGTFNGTFAADRTSAAAAFTLVDVSQVNTGTVTFRDAAGAALTGATFNYTGVGSFDETGNHKDFYFGWDSVAQSTAAIGSIVITKTATGTFDPKGGTVGIDDFAFTVVPEPSSFALAVAGLCGLLARRRRRH